jgi:putative transposase
MKDKIEEGHYYHIYNRGNNKGLIFFEEANYHYFLEKFEMYVVPHCEVFAYCLMPNHFHLFLKTNDKRCFERGLRNFFISYVKSINKRYQRVGSLFQGRYKAKEITSSGYFTNIVTYIHRNPVEAGLVTQPEDYHFSSYHFYLYPTDGLLTKNPVIEWFSGLELFIASH